jgi:hypothetical protein
VVVQFLLQGHEVVLDLVDLEEGGVGDRREEL